MIEAFQPARRSGKQSVAPPLDNSFRFGNRTTRAKLVGCDLMGAKEMKTVKSVICLFAVAVPAIGLSISSPALGATICCNNDDGTCRIAKGCHRCNPRDETCAQDAGCGEIVTCCLYDGCERTCVIIARDCCTALGGVAPLRQSCLRCPDLCRPSEAEETEAEQIPTVSAWGVVTLVLILVGGLAIKFRRHGAVRG